MAKHLPKPQDHWPVRDVIENIIARKVSAKFVTWEALVKTIQASELNVTNFTILRHVIQKMLNERTLITDYREGYEAYIKGPVPYSVRPHLLEDKNT